MKIKITKLCVAVMLAAGVGGFAGCAGNDYERTTGQYIDDRALTLRVKNALDENTQYKFHDVNVTSYLGHVQLSGFVATDEQKDKAADIAQRVRGVVEVDNKISIRPTTSAQ